MATMKSYENKCSTNYSTITNNNWNNAYNKQLFKHDTNDDVDTTDIARIFVPQLMMTPHTHGSSLERFHTPSMVINMAHSPSFNFSLFFYLFLLSVTVFLFHVELFLELHYTKVMTNLRLTVKVSATGYEPNLLTFGELNDSSVPFSFMIPSTDQDMDDMTLGEMLTAAHRGQADYCDPEGVSVSQSSLSIVFDGSGKPDERNSSNAQISTLLDLQRQTKIAEYREKVNHHELHAAHAEKERRLLQGQLWRQKLEFCEAHQQSPAEMEELRKFQSSTFDTIAKRKLIEDQNTILELSGRVQELQIEVNCMNDSKDFQDAESFRSGNSNVTNVTPTSSDTWKDVEAFFRVAVPQRRAAKHLGHTWYIGKCFCRSTCTFINSSSLHREFAQEEMQDGGQPLRSRVICLQRRTVKDQNKIEIWDANLDRQPKSQSSSVEETIQRILEQTNNDCRFRTLTLSSSYTNDICLLEVKVQERGMYLFAISYGSDAMGQKSGVGWFSRWFKIFVINEVFQCRILKYSIRGLLQRWTISPIIHTFKRRINLEEKKSRSGTVSFVTDRLPTWSTINSGSLESWFWTMPTSLSVNEMMIFRNSILNGTEFYCPWRKFSLITLGRIAQIKNTRVWQTENCIEIVWPGDASEENITWFSKIEDNGKKRSINQEIRNKNDQKWNFWDKRRGQESGNKTACTKNSWRLLAMGVQRAIF